MTDILKYKSVYFLGIGGIGMSAIARYFKIMGADISGYDRTSTPLTRELQSEGMSIHYKDDISLIPGNTDLVIYTPAIPANHSEFKYLLGKKIPVMKRAEILGIITRRTKTIAIAGTHGKTTTTTLIAHLMVHSGKSVVAFLGGISKNYGTNLIVADKQEISSSKNIAWMPEYFVAEADEYDRSFLQLEPEKEIVSSVDPDHLDIYGNVADLRNSFRNFTSKIPSDGCLVMKHGIALTPDQTSGYRILTYSVEGPGDYSATNIRHEKGEYCFDLITPEKKIHDIVLGLPGRFNLENAIAASAIALQTGIPESTLKEALATYSGVKRRFDFQVKRADCVYIDDYAHHPAELHASISAARELYPDKKITGIFQPHLYTRTRDLADDFAKSLELLDELILMDIYPAREKPIPGITSSMLLGKVNLKEKYLMNKEEILEWIKSHTPEVIMTLGAGNIDTLVKPITKLLEKPE
ncbi:MAG: UDP-N-acetylmuramate--L-alanine ligase [Bacteroidota bacterium]|nr:UDP-N-acetylmuramate--L-alanine ligase [Bacteroidota bacterium]